MHSDQFAPEIMGRSHQGQRHKFTAIEEDCPIGDIMSVPLDRLCQLSWLFLRRREWEGAGKPTTTTTPQPSSYSSPSPHAETEDAQLARAINARVTEIIRFFQGQPWWGQLSCHTLRLALFKKTLHSILLTSTVAPAAESISTSCSSSSPVAPQNTPVTGEIQSLGAAGSAASHLRTTHGSSDGSISNDDATSGKARVPADKRRIASMDWVLPYLSGQEDERWLADRVREMVDMAFVSNNEYQKHLISNAAYVSVHVQHQKRGAQVFFLILQEVLDRWNAAPGTTGEAGTFGFGVVIPILNITRCTQFSNTDVVTVGKLLASVRVPSRGRNLSNESLSNATFVTRYDLSILERATEEREQQDNEEEDVDGTEDEEDMDEEDTHGFLPFPHMSLPSVFSRLGMLANEPALRETPHRRVEHGVGGGAVSSTMITDLFLVAPLARKMSVHVRKASHCEGVQIVLLPCTSNSTTSSSFTTAAATPVVAGTPIPAEEDEDEGGGDGGEVHASVNDETASNDKQPVKPVWFEPREGETHEIIGGCNAVLRYKRSPDESAQPRLQAEVRVETSLEVDGRWVEELRSTVSSAQVVIADSLLQRVKNGFPISGSSSSSSGGETRLREELLVLFHNGLLPQARTEKMPPFVVEILTLDEGTFRKRVLCRYTDIRGVRAALSLVAMFLTHSETEQLSWELRMWQDVVRRVILSSSALGKNHGATEIATFVLEHVILCKLSMPQIVEGVIALLTSNFSVNEVRTILTTQRTRAEMCVLALSLLQRAKENFIPKGMFHVVSLLRDFMRSDGSHYLLRFQGCGELLEKKIRDLVHQLLSDIFTALHRVMSLPEGGREKHGPHRFLWDTNEFGPFALVSLSLLVSPLDARDVDFIGYKIASQIEGLLPNFTNFSRSASFKVNEMEEGTMLDALQSLVNNFSVHPESTCIQSYGDRSEEILTDNNSNNNNNNDNNNNRNANNRNNNNMPSVGMVMTGASERGIGVWVPTGRERVCSTSIPLYTSGVQLSSTPYMFPASSPSSSTSPYPYSPSMLLPSINTSSVTSPPFCTAEVQLLSAPAKDLIVALSSEQQAAVTLNTIKDDPKGFYFFPHDGILHHNGSQVILPPLFQGDKIIFSFSFSPQTSTRSLSLLLNDIPMIEFPALSCQQLFLLSGVMESSTLRTHSLRICFRPHKEINYMHPIMKFGNDDIVTKTLPTRYTISIFATNVLFYLISLCARRVAQCRRQLGAAGVGGSPHGIITAGSSPMAAGNQASILQAEEVWRGFVDVYCNLLRQNVESLIGSIKRLPSLTQVGDVTERVKRNVASCVYHRFLMDYITMIRTTIRCSSAPLDMLSTLSIVVCCDDVGEEERCLALTIIWSLLCDSPEVIPIRMYNPLPLWDCCYRLSRHVMTCAYKPVFTRRSASKEMVICSGGRRIKSTSLTHGNNRSSSASAATATSPPRSITSYASQGIPLDGSLGDIVSFSARLQRSLTFDTLGRFYYVGLVCLSTTSTSAGVESYPGGWKSKPYTYIITDHFTDIPSSSARVELLRYAKNWLSSEENIIFGSGDVITVVLNTKLRCISFERNGLPLGTLYINISSKVKVLFPFVELFNRDASALWMYAPREVGIRARFTMRAMLYHWGPELMPKLKEKLKPDVSNNNNNNNNNNNTAGDIVALEILGADGDETNFWYRHPPRSSVKGSHVVHLMRQMGSMAEVVMEGSNRTMRVLSMALEPNYNISISNNLPVSLVIEELISVISHSLQFIQNTNTNNTNTNNNNNNNNNESGNSTSRRRRGSSSGSSGRSIHIKPIKIFLYALRLLSEMELSSLLSYDIETLQCVLDQLIHVLTIPDIISSEGSFILIEAWNEFMLLQDDDELWISIPEDTESHRNDDDNIYTSRSNISNVIVRNEEEEEAEEEKRISDVCLHCPACDKEWGMCTSEDHVAPQSLCFTLHCVLGRLGAVSPFTGLICDWFREGTPIHVNIRVTPSGEVEGEGEETRGLFTFTGKYISSHFIRGNCVYKFVENPTIHNQLEEEWTCDLCTFINLADSTRCAMCTTARPGATWTCMLCSYAFNSNTNSICTTCGHQRMGAAETSAQSEKMKKAYCESCWNSREYISFHDFNCRAYCDECGRVSAWLPDERYTGLVEGLLVGDGDMMDWVVVLRSHTAVYAGLRNSMYSLQGMKEMAEAISPGASDLSRYVPPLVQGRPGNNDNNNNNNNDNNNNNNNNNITGTSVSSSSASQQQQQQQQRQQGEETLEEEGEEEEDEEEEERKHRGVIPAILFFSSRIVCRWAPFISLHKLASKTVLHRLRILDESWLNDFDKIPFEAARHVFSSCLNILISSVEKSEHTIRSLSYICRVLMRHHPQLRHQRHYVLYSLCLNIMRCHENRKVRGICYHELNILIEETCEEKINVQCLPYVISLMPLLPEQQRLMIHASLHDINISMNTNVICISLLIRAIEKMEKKEELPAIFDEYSPDIFPHLIELPDTRLGDSGELILGQVRGSVGIMPNRGGQYYYEIIIPPNFSSNDRNKIIMMGWGTIQHEVMNSGQHVGSDIYSWGFNCQDRLRILTGEQLLSVPHPVVGGDIIGALLDLDAMMMCWSINGEQLMWVSTSILSKGEAIYPYISASVDSAGIHIRLSHTQFKPEKYKDFTPFSSYAVIKKGSHVKPQSYNFYVELCHLGNDLVNCGFTVDSLLQTNEWFNRALCVLYQYPEIYQETQCASTNSDSDSSSSSLLWLKPYFQHLSCINSLAINVSKSYNILHNSPLLLRNYQKTQQLLFFSARWAIVERQLNQHLLRHNVRRHLEVVIDLNRSKGVLQSNENVDFLTRFEGCITGQLFRQIKDADIYHDAVMFNITLTGEVADDVGGVTRSIITMMCDEINYREDDESGMRADPFLPFFKLTGHTTMMTIVPNMEFCKENNEHRALCIQFFTWLGKLLGNATVSGYLMFSLTFPRLVWKFLTFDTITIEDYYADIDDTVRGALHDDEFLLNDEFFYAIPGIQKHEELMAESMSRMRSTRMYPAMTPPVRSALDLASVIPLPEENEENITLLQRRKDAEQALIHQYDELLIAMRTGMTSVIPPLSLQLIRWDDLQQRVCGNPYATAEDVLSSLNLSLLSEDLRQMLREVVHDWTHKRRSQFLLFCSGQRRIPLPEKVQVTCGDDPSAIPSAHTCSPISLLLQPYPSVEVMREKLEMSLRHVYEFGFA